jgi:hypothetical protein
MTPPVEPLPLYRPRNPRDSDLWRLIDRHFDTFRRVYDQRFADRYGFWRPIVEQSVAAFLRCGDLHEGFARVRCSDCGHEMFVAFSCKQRCTCPSCHQKRTLLTSIHVAEDVCFPVAHRQVVLTIPKRLRLHTRFDRKLLGKLCSCACRCIVAEVRRQLGHDDMQPGIIATIQTHGELLHWHPHIHTLVTCGAFTASGEFLELPALDMDRLLLAWREAVFALYLAEGKIEPAAVENMRGWPHSGFSVDQSVHLPAGDRAGIERLMQYMTRCPFSLSRLIKVTATGQVVYKAEKDACRAFPDPQGNGLTPGPKRNFFHDELAAGPKRNFQVLDPLDFLAEFTQHIPPKGTHLIRYYGWYSNKSRGMRRKAAEAEAATSPRPLGEGQGVRAGRCSQTWAMLIKRVYEVDPLACPKCGGVMKVIAFIEPPQGALIEKILRHCGLWRPSTPRPPPGDFPSPNGSGAGGEGGDDAAFGRFDSSDWSDPVDFSACDFSAGPTASSDEPGDWTYVDIDTFESDVDESEADIEYKPAF